VSAPDPRWAHNPRVRVDSLAPGAHFLGRDGRRYDCVRQDAVTGAHVVVDSESNLYTQFSGCAEVVPVPR